MKEDLINKILSKKGQFTKLTWDRTCKTKKDAPLVRKITTLQIARLGITYDNMNKVQRKRETGELPKENQGLPSWCEWAIYPYFGRNKNNGQIYLRVYPRPNSKVFHYEIGGKKVDSDSVGKFLGAQEKQENDLICQWVKVEDIKDIS